MANKDNKHANQGEFVIQSEEESDGDGDSQNTEAMIKQLKAIQVPIRRGPGRPKKKKKSSLSNSMRNKTTDTSSAGSFVAHGSYESDATLGRLIQSLTEEVIKLGNEVGGLRKKIEEMGQETKNLNMQIIDLLTKVENLEKENANMKLEITNRDKKLDSLQERIDRMEMKELKNQFWISTPEIENMDDSCFKASVANMTATALKISPATLSKFSYVKVGKVGSKKALVTVDKSGDRAQFFQAAKTLRPRNFYINEVLIKSQDQLFYEVRKYRRLTQGKYYLYTYFGVVYLKKSPGDRPIRLKTVDDLIGCVQE